MSRTPCNNSITAGLVIRLMWVVLAVTSRLGSRVCRLESSSSMERTRTRLQAFRSPRQWAIRTPTKLSALNRSVLGVEHPLSEGRPLRCITHSLAVIILLYRETQLEHCAADIRAIGHAICAF